MNAAAAWALIRENVMGCENGAKIHHDLVYAVDEALKSPTDTRIRNDALEEAAVYCEQRAMDGVADLAACRENMAQMIRGMKAG